MKSPNTSKMASRVLSRMFSSLVEGIMHQRPSMFDQIIKDCARHFLALALLKIRFESFDRICDDSNHSTSSKSASDLVNQPTHFSPLDQVSPIDSTKKESWPYQSPVRSRIITSPCWAILFFARLHLGRILTFIFCFVNFGQCSFKPKLDKWQSRHYSGNFNRANMHLY